MRTFIGIPFPHSYKEIMMEIISRIQSLNPPALKWVKPENMHLTLHFIGEIPPVKVEELEDALSYIKYPSYIFCAGSGGFFPSIKRPRVIWVGCRKGGVETQELFCKIGEVLRERSLLREEKGRFSPHLTLARIKSKGPLPLWQRTLSILQQTPWPEIKVDSFVLWKSTLTPAGPIYTPLKRYALL